MFWDSYLGGFSYKLGLGILLKLPQGYDWLNKTSRWNLIGQIHKTSILKRKCKEYAQTGVMAYDPSPVLVI